MVDLLAGSRLARWGGPHTTLQVIYNLLLRLASCQNAYAKKYIFYNIFGRQMECVLTHGVFVKILTNF